MGLFLLALFIIWAAVELTVIAAVANLVGVLDTVALLVLVSLAGAFLTKRAGFGAAQRIRNTQADGRLPSTELIDGFLIFVAGVLLVVPGFVSGGLGLALLLPPVRALARVLIVRRFKNHGDLVVVRTSQRATRPGREIWDADSWEEPPESPQKPEIEGPS